MSSFLPRGLVHLLACSALVSSAALACGKLETVGESRDAGSGPAASDGGEPFAPRDGGPGASGSTCPLPPEGVCLPAGATAPPSYQLADPAKHACSGGEACWLRLPPSSFTPACAKDFECNDDIGVSAILGTCFEGICVCQPGLFVQKSGKCGKLPPPGCAEQGGRCEISAARPPRCAVGIEGSEAAAAKCLGPATGACCYAEATCKGPTDFKCCPSGTTLITGKPICENGWLTCPQDAFAVRSSLLCD